MPMIEWSRMVSFFDADLTSLEKGVTKGIKLVDKLEKRVKNFKGDLTLGKGGSSGSATSPIDKEMKAAEADIKRFEQERVRIAREGERLMSRVVEQEAKIRENVRTREYKHSIDQLGAQVKAEKKAVSQSKPTSPLAGRSAFTGGLIGGGIAGLAIGAGRTLVGIATDGREAYLSLEKLVRFVSTLDRGFQTPQGLMKLRTDIEKLSNEVPQSAENIAKAAFTIKSAYSNMSEPELINFLRKFSVAATASNTTVDLHADRVAALAKMYKITADELDSFGAIISTAFGDALATDSQVGEGFNKILVSARMLKQPINEVAAAMGAIQSTSSDAEKNTTNLQNVFAKLADPKYVAGMKKTFNVDVSDAQGRFKGLNEIVNELAKSVEGLSDKERSAKIGEVFKDLQAREGISSLIDVLDQYNNRLRDGADADAWAAKQATMLGSADAKWQLLTNRADEYKRSLGKSISDPLTSAMDSQTKMGAFDLFGISAQKQIVNGTTGILEAIESSWTDIRTAMQVKAGTIDESAARTQIEEVRKKYEGLRKQIEQGSTAYKISILRAQKEEADAIVSDLNMGDTARNKAKQQSAALATALKEQADIYATAGFEANKSAAVKAADGLKAADPEVRAAAMEAGAKLLEELTVNLSLGGSPETQAKILKLMSDLAASMTAAGASLDKPGAAAGAAFDAGVTTGIQSGQSDIAAAANAAFPATSPEASAKGSTLGSQFAAGMAAGLRGGYGPIGAAVAGMIDWAFTSGKQAQDSHSPSVRAAMELGLPFVQGIEVGIKAREAMLANTTAGVIRRAMLGPKNKQDIQKNLKQIFDDTVYAAGRIDPGASRSRDEIERFYDGMLTDRSTSFDDQVKQITEYYSKLYDVENQAYKDRLANITRQEELIRQRKDLKPQEKSDMLRGLGDQRRDENTKLNARIFDIGKQQGSDINNAAAGQVDLNQRSFSRGNEDEVARIQNLITEYTKMRDQWDAGSSEYIEWNNKIIGAIEDRKDAEVAGSKVAEKSRQDDIRSLEDLKRSVSDFARDTRDSQLNAEEAKLELMKSVGGRQRDVVIAEMNLSIERENFQFEQRQKDIRRRAEELNTADTTGVEIVRINLEMNAQLEAEAARHNAAMAQITANGAQNSILAEWKKMAAVMPNYRDQLRSFALDIPNAIGNIWDQTIQGMDGTWTGFLSSMKRAFFQTVAQMLADYGRTQLIKGLIGLGTSLFGGALGGSAAGSGGGVSSGAGSWGGGWGFADGGEPPVGRLSLVGERGPELFVPKVGGRILTNDETKQALSGSGGGGDTYNMSVTQVFKGPRGLVSPKSTRQQTEAAVTGLSYATKGRRN
ncbi:hypothetical protein BH10ACI2_BH10ACI2_04360 [soil metagenome]